MNSKYTYVLFDLGNVVIQIDFEKSFQYWSQKTGKPVEELKKLFVVDEPYCHHERGEISGQDYHEHLCQKFGVQLSYDDFVVGWNALLGPLVPETAQFIEEAQGRLKLYGFTNSNQIHRQAWKPKYAETLGKFQHVYCSSEIRCRKPEARGFQLILNDLQIQPEQMVFVDDLAENCEGARALGIQTVHFTDPKKGIAELRKLVF